MILLLGTIFGFLLARRLLAEPCWWLSLTVAPLLGLFTALLWGGVTLRWLPWWPWMASTALLFGLGIRCLRRLPEPAAFRAPSPGWWCYLLIGGSGVTLFAWFHQSVGMVVDGDFFIHGANVGLFSRGYLPPVNPFLGVPMHGHYGRDLAIAIFSRDFALSPLTAEWVLTWIWQLLSFILLAFWLRRELDCDAAGVLGSGLAFFGMSFSSYCGLSELVANNNPIAFCLLIVIGWVVFRAFHQGRSSWVVAGLLLGLDAMIYENHFGVVGLSLLLFWRRPRMVLTVGLLALITAVLLSGVVRSTARGAPESGSEQTIRVRLFKKEIFCLRTDNLRPSRPFETRARPWAADFAPSSLYQPLWSPAILNSFWYPVWLLPCTTLLLAWSGRRFGFSPVGLWWACVGWLSLLAPALADFGFFEAETARWLVVTALGAAVALGVGLGQWWHRRPRSGVPLTLLLLAINSVSLQVALHDLVQAYRHPGRDLPVGRPGLPPGHGLLPNPQLALQHHYGISADVLEVAAWIRAHSRLGEHFLCDSGDLPPNARGTLIGATGLLPAMEAAPPPWSRSVNSYQTNLQQRGFWATGDLLRLDPQVDWLLVTRSAARFGRPDYEQGTARAYRLAARPPSPEPGAGSFALRFDRSAARDQPVVFRYEGPMGCLLELRFGPLAEVEFVADQNIQSTASASRMIFMTPYEVGEYRVEARLSPDAAWQDFGTLTVR